jgi:hypothetical protein
MTKAFADYTYIAGNHGPRGSLWQGPDHLLVVDGTGWLISVAEVYRRVDYANIQSITMVRTKGYFWMGLVWGVGAFMFSCFAGLAMNAGAARLFLAGMFALPAALMTVALIVHLAKGPTCACALQTNVQLLRLRALNRLRTAQPVMQTLAGLCREHQGVLSSAEVAAAAAAAKETKPSSAPDLAGAKPPWTGTAWTTAAGGVFMLWGLALIGELFVPGLAFTLLNAALGAAALVVGLIALVRSLSMQAPGSLLAGLWGALAVALAAIVILVAPAVGIIAREDLQGGGRIDPEESFSVERIVATIANATYADAGKWGPAAMGVGGMLFVMGLAIMAGGRVAKVAAQAAPQPPSKPPAMPMNPSA